MERIDVDLAQVEADLREVVTRKPHSMRVEPRKPGDAQKENRERDRDSDPPLEHLVKVRVALVIVVANVADEAFLIEQDGVQVSKPEDGRLIAFAAFKNALRKRIDPRELSFDVELRVFFQRDEQRSLGDVSRAQLARGEVLEASPRLHRVDEYRVRDSCHTGRDLSSAVRPDRSEAIILQSIPSRERDKLIVFLTPEKGKRKGWAYGARGLRNRFGAALEPLAKVELVFLEKESEEAVRIESASMIRSAFPAQQELARSLAATYIAESVETFVQADDPSELVYRLLDRIVEALLAGRPVEPIVAYAEVWILKLGGVFASIRHCAICQKPLERPLRCDIRGGFVCSGCAEPGVTLIANRVAELLGALLLTPVDAFAAMPIAADDLFELRALARDLRRYVLGHELKTHDLLQSVIRG